MHKVLGIDPGIERLGWALVEKNNSEFTRLDSGVKRTSPNLSTSKRIYEIHRFLHELIRKEIPDAVSIEKLFFTTNAKTAMTIGEVRGTILTVSEMNSLIIHEFTPLQVKMAVCGYGKASKRDVASMLEYAVKLPKSKLLDDETDAIALAITAFVHKSYS
jgi:crossover junction endodeoxyribonuclease RuvC